MRHLAHSCAPSEQIVYRYGDIHVSQNTFDILYIASCAPHLPRMWYACGETEQCVWRAILERTNRHKYNINNNNKKKHRATWQMGSIRVKSPHYACCGFFYISSNAYRVMCVFVPCGDRRCRDWAIYSNLFGTCRPRARMLSRWLRRYRSRADAHIAHRARCVHLDAQCAARVAHWWGAHFM